MSGWVEGESKVQWTTLSKEDLNRAREDINGRRKELEMRHAEVIAALQEEHARACGELNTKLAEIDDLERGLEAFASEFLENQQRTRASVGIVVNDVTGSWQDPEKQLPTAMVH